MTETERQVGKALSLYSVMLKVDDGAAARSCLETDPPETSLENLKQFEQTMIEWGWAKSSAAQYTYHLRRILRSAGADIPRKPRRPLPLVRGSRHWHEGMLHKCPSLPATARLIGYSEPALLAEGLRSLAKDHVGAAKQRLLATARELARLDGSGDAT